MKIFFHRTFVKKFLRLDPRLQARFRRRRDLLLKDPTHSLLRNHPLSGKRTGQWSINVTSDWRALYISGANQDEVIFIDIDTHSNLYK